MEMPKKIHVINEDDTCAKCGPVGVMRLGATVMCKVAYLQCNARQRRVLLEAQMADRPFVGRCDMCGDALPTRSDAHLDHDNTTGYARGWLCGRCNVGLGMFLDSPARLVLAIEYLGRSQAAQGVRGLDTRRE